MHSPVSHPLFRGRIQSAMRLLAGLLAVLPVPGSAGTSASPLLEYPAYPGSGGCAANAGYFATAGMTLQSLKSGGNGAQYVAMFRAGTWDGDVVAQPAGRASAGILWSAALMLNAFTSPDSSRNIWTLRPSTARASAGAVEFTATELQRAGLWDAMATTEPVLHYLRGDRTLEGSQMRPRASLMGDVIGAAPLALKGQLDMQYDLLPAGAPGRNDYRKFVRDKAARAGLVLFSANDGMVHAVRQIDGVEVFAFVPPAVLPFMAQLAAPRYMHRFLVDGPLVETDGWWAGRWHNAVLGTNGAGPAAVFAMDMTDTAAPGAKSVLWQFSAADDAELGNVLGAPEAGVLANGQWVALFGNGVASASGKARLYVVDLATGALVRAIDVPAEGLPNGLGAVRVLRDDGNRIVAAYAGDLRGNLWRFELSSSNPAQWAVGHNSRPLFTARDPDGVAQAITAAPEYLPHPLGGWLVLAGTGKLHEDVDVGTRQVQSLYGVRDLTPAGQSSSTAGVVADIGTLVSQKLTNAGAAFPSVQASPIDWKTSRGWRVDLPSGFRDVYGPALVKGFARFKVVSPLAVEPIGGCARTASAAIDLQLNPMTGGAATRPVFDTNADGAVTEQDAMAAGFRTSAGRPGALVVTPTGSGRITSPGDKPVVMDYGRTPVLRTWRQIINFPR